MSTTDTRNRAPLRRRPAAGAVRRVSRTIASPVRPAMVRARRDRTDGLRPLLDLLVGVAVISAVGAHALVVVLYALACPVAVSAAGGYGVPSFGASARIRTALHLSVAATVSGWLAVTATALADEQLSFASIALLWLGSVAGWSATRFVVRRIERRAPERVVVLGSGVVARRIEALIDRFGEGRFELLGFVADDPAHAGTPTFPWLGDARNLRHLLEKHAVERVIVAFSAGTDATTTRMIRECDSFGVQIDVIPRLYEFVTTQSNGYALGDLPLVSIPPRMPLPAQRIAKRGMDILVSGLLLLLTLPINVVFALLIFLGDRGPVLYRQKRVGRDGHTFEILKYRSMRVEADTMDVDKIEALRRGDVSIADAVQQIKGGDDPRVTRIGHFLRRTSCDEIPQLWNVLKGDMSLVGPRPLRPFEVENLQPWERTRLLERPGITGLWQVTGRSDAHWAERMQLDYSYVRHWSLSRDLEILARTVRVVLTGDGAR